MANLTLSSPSYSARTNFGSVLSGGSGQVANPFPTNGTWSVVGWIRDTARNAVRVAVGAPSTAWIGCDGSNNAMARYGTNGAGEVSLSSSVNVMDGQWHHVALVLGPSGGRFFVDGVLVASSATTASGAGTQYTSDLGVRTFPGATSFDWQGDVDEVEVWSTERYTSGFTPPTAPTANGTSGLISLWHLDGNGLDTAGPATSVTLSGPSSGAVGVASTPFTVGANGGITGTVTVTPSDGGAGGTFSPASVAISSGTPTATFTYTPSTTGARSISVTNDGGLSNPSPITYTATSGAATAVTLSGPSSGTVGVASTNFTVGANGSITGTVTVTPSDSGAGGTFTPAAVNISSGTPTATFTYTAASAATHSISVTNNGGLSNPSPISYTASSGGVTPIAPNNAAILYSPYTWHVNASRAQTINPGAYFRVLFTGSTCTLNFDMSNVSAPVPRMRIRVDGRTDQSASLASTISVNMPSGQDNTTHLLEVWVDATSETVNRWNSPQNAVVKLTGITLASGGDTVTAPQRRPLNILCYGDSITEGVRTLALNGTADVDRNSATVCWPLELGRQLGAEVGVVGFGSQGISDTGNGNVPNLRNSWDLLYAGQSRTFTPEPDYCIWLQGYNDGTSNTQADGIAALNGMLTAMPSTQFVLFRPLDGTNQAANLQAIAAGCSDPSRVRYISTAGFWSSPESPDALHPYGWADMANIAPRMAAAILTPAARTARTVTVTLTTDGTTTAANLTGLRWAFFDSPQPQSFGVPASQGTGETTDALGVLTVSVSTTLASGGVGWLDVTNSDGTVAMEHSGFSGPVQVA